MNKKTNLIAMLVSCIIYAAPPVQVELQDQNYHNSLEAVKDLGNKSNLEKLFMMLTEGKPCFDAIKANSPRTEALLNFLEIRVMEIERILHRISNFNNPEEHADAKAEEVANLSNTLEKLREDLKHFQYEEFRNPASVNIALCDAAESVPKKDLEQNIVELFGMPLGIEGLLLFIKTVTRGEPLEAQILAEAAGKLHFYWADVVDKMHTRITLTGKRFSHIILAGHVKDSDITGLMQQLGLPECEELFVIIPISILGPVMKGLDLKPDKTDSVDATILRAKIGPVPFHMVYHPENPLQILRASREKERDNLIQKVAKLLPVYTTDQVEKKGEINDLELQIAHLNEELAKTPEGNAQESKSINLILLIIQSWARIKGINDITCFKNLYDTFIKLLQISVGVCGEYVMDIKFEDFLANYKTRFEGFDSKMHESLKSPALVMKTSLKNCIPILTEEFRRLERYITIALTGKLTQYGRILGAKTNFNALFKADITYSTTSIISDPSSLSNPFLNVEPDRENFSNLQTITNDWIPILEGIHKAVASPEPTPEKSDKDPDHLVAQTSAEPAATTPKTVSESDA